MSSEHPSNNDWNQEALNKVLETAEASPALKPQIPARPVRKVKHRYTLLALLCVVGTLFFGWKWAKEVSVTAMAVTGNFYTTEDDIIRASGIKPGLQPDSLDLLEIIHNIEKLPYVKEAYLSFSSRGMLQARVVEREPLALLIENDKKCYVDEDGVKLPVNLGKIPDVPLLYGFKVLPMQDTLRNKTFGLVRDFLHHASQHPVLHATISEVAYSSDEGVIALSHENGVKLIFGKEDFAEKLSVWRGFYAQVVPEKGISKFQSLDFRFSGQVVARES